MSNVAYHLAGGLSQSQLEQVRTLVDSILWDVGLDIDHEPIREFLAKQEGVRLQGKRVCYSRPLVEHALAQQRPRRTPTTSGSGRARRPGHFARHICACTCTTC